MAYDYKGYDGKDVAGKSSLGTEAQDAHLIADTFERAAHSDTTEASVFAPITRTLTNTKNFSDTVQTTLGGYHGNPATKALKEAAAETTDPDMADLFSMATGTDPDSPVTKWIKDCIPCTFRLTSLFELLADFDLYGLLLADLKARLAMLQKLLDMLTDFGSFSDYCDFMDLMSFMCVPDLQRIIALLMALLQGETQIRLDGLLNLIKMLVAPLFVPLLMSALSLLDQFSQLILGPLKCVVDALTAHLEKLKFSVPDVSGVYNNTFTDETKYGNIFKTEKTAEELYQEASESAQDAAAIKSAQEKGQALQKSLDDSAGKLTDGVNKATDTLYSGIKELRDTIDNGIRTLQAKLNWYIEQIQKILEEELGGDNSYLEFSWRKLKYVRLISFVKSIIEATVLGKNPCGGGSSKTGNVPSSKDLDNFFNNFLNPKTKFVMKVDDKGNLHINSPEPELPDTENVLKFDGGPDVAGSLGEDIMDQIQSVYKGLSDPISITFPCRLKTTPQDAAVVNKWIQDLNV